MPVLYNEIEPHAAAWLSNLIAMGELPDGVVDERSIVDVRGDDLAGFDECHFFAGIGVWARAVREAETPPDIALRGRSSPAHVHVSRFRRLDSEKAMSTNDTSGPLFTASSPSAALQRSLESRLRARTGGSGWPLFAMTWRPADMPSGPPSCQLAASARRTSATACSGWPHAERRRCGSGRPDATGEVSGRPYGEPAGRRDAGRLADADRPQGGGYWAAG